MAAQDESGKGDFIMQLNVAVIDDNQTDIKYVSGLVSLWAEAAVHTVRIRTFQSAEEFLFHYEEDKEFDILLLDIEMGDMNGVELAKKIRQDNDFVQMVFITGFPDFMAEGYEVSALHYLMKPVSEEKLHNVLDKAVGNLEKSEKRLCVTFERQTVFVPLRQILYIEAQKQYVQIYCAQRSGTSPSAGPGNVAQESVQQEGCGEIIYRMKESLSNIEKQVDEYFLKCQRSFLVNLRHVSQIKRNCVVLKNGAEVPISRGMAEQIGKEIIRLF